MVDHPWVAVVCDRKRWPAELTADTLREALAAGLDVNARIEGRDSTILHAAVHAPMPRDALLPLDVLDALLAAGADVNVLDSFGRTPLMVAAGQPDPERPEAAERGLAIMRRLREAGGRAVPGTSKRGDITGTLHYTSLSPEAYSLLHEAGAPLDQRDDQGRLSLHSAARAGDAQKVLFLLDHGADIDALDGLGQTPIGLAQRTREEPWVPHNKLTAKYDAVIAALEVRGGHAERAYEWDGTAFGPRPLPDDALSAAWPKLAGKVSSAQALVNAVRHDGEGEVVLEGVAKLAAALGPPRTLRIDGDLDTGRHAFFWHGDVEVTGNVSIGALAMITGSLRSEGVVTDGDTPYCVSIGGDVACRGLYTIGDFAVAGAITAREVVIGYYNDCVLIARMIRAPVVISDDHTINAAVESPHYFDMDRYSRGHGDGVSEELRVLFVDEVFDEEGQLVNAEVFERLRLELPLRRIVA
jgi:Ankyrin repeats (many copies)